MPTPFDPKIVRSIEDFIAFASGTGFARANRFMVVIHKPPALSGDKTITSQDLSLLCEDVTFPGKTLGTRTVRINALPYQRAQTLDYMQDSVSMTFLVDSKWKVREFFDKWIQAPITQELESDGTLKLGSDGKPETADTDRPYRLVQFYDDYVSEIQLVALSLLPRNVVQSAIKDFGKRTIRAKVEAVVVPTKRPVGLFTRLAKKVQDVATNRITSAIGLKIYKEKNKINDAVRQGGSKFSAGLQKKVPRGLRGIVGDIATGILPTHVFVPLDVAHITQHLTQDRLGYDVESGARKFNKLPENVNHVLSYLQEALIGYNPTTGRKHDVPRPEDKPHINLHADATGKLVSVGYDGAGRIEDHKPTIPSRREPADAETGAYIFYIHEVYPKSIEVQSMSSNNVDQYQRLKVNFVFNWYRVQSYDFKPENRLTLQNRIPNPN